MGILLYEYILVQTFIDLSNKFVYFVMQLFYLYLDGVRCTCVMGYSDRAFLYLPPHFTYHNQLIQVQRCLGGCRDSGKTMTKFKKESLGARDNAYKSWVVLFFSFKHVNVQSIFLAIWKGNARHIAIEYIYIWQ